RHGIDAWIEKGKYSKLVDLWAKGLQFDWEKLYAAGQPRRVSLPTYPFARERYWIDVASAALTTDTLPASSLPAPASSAPSALAEPPTVARCPRLLAKQWRSSAAMPGPLLVRHVAIVATEETWAFATQVAQRFDRSHIVKLEDAAPSPQDVAAIPWDSCEG